MGLNMTGQELANTVSRFVNNFSCDSKGFVETVLKDHPTLQQSTMRLCFELIQGMANQTCIDERNKNSVTACKRITSMCGDVMRLPLI